WLQCQQGHRQVVRQPSDVPGDPQTIAQAILLDPQITAAQTIFLCPGGQVVGLGEIGAEQVGQVQHCGFGLVRVNEVQAEDDVEAVEQELRADARLQRLQQRLESGLVVQMPLLLQVEIAQ